MISLNQSHAEAKTKTGEYHCDIEQFRSCICNYCNKHLNDCKQKSLHIWCKNNACQDISPSWYLYLQNILVFPQRSQFFSNFTLG